MTRMLAIVHAAARLAPMSSLPRATGCAQAARRRSGAAARSRDAGTLPSRFRFA
ncbi:hypothetical protein MNO14_01000 [Luteimonas sp. S4-F44]|uniref:hypothetical protein n=1 Tax=Luteimonas sp. S4-F44 TaxID=2925842 RepID=UPI001F52EFA0|nr:hypothetical protein [Luteimonas sp. S4-F44]UNK42717.1 hypothetical protein MNO14_01000 [Luteimonas sp. S4-F44]